MLFNQSMTTVFVNCKLAFGKNNYLLKIILVNEIYFTYLLIIPVEVKFQLANFKSKAFFFLIQVFRFKCRGMVQDVTKFDIALSKNRSDGG